MFEVFDFTKVPTTVGEVIDAQVKFTKDLLDTQAAMLKSFVETFQPKKAA